MLTMKERVLATVAALAFFASIIGLALVVGASALYTFPGILIPIISAVIVRAGITGFTKLSRSSARGAARQAEEDDSSTPLV